MALKNQFNSERLNHLTVTRNGSIAVAVGLNSTSNQGLMYISTNYGTDWMVSNLGSLIFTNVAVSDDGAYTYACITGGYLNWTVAFYVSQNWRSISVSSNGKNVFTASSNNVFCSFDFGLSWQNCLSSVSNLNVIATDKPGKYVFSTEAGGYVYSSSNNGIQWNISFI